jgi:phenylacetate-coenzyme A ligase PaaK-like adenylate-forming protein
MDALETRAPAEREAALLAALPAQIAHARSASSAFAEILAGIDPAAITSRTALATLPITRKHELLARQQLVLARDGQRGQRGAAGDCSRIDTRQNFGKRG